MKVPRERRGERLDQVLASLLPAQSRAAIQRLMREGRVRVAGSAPRPAYLVRGGEEVEIEIPPPAPAGVTGEDLPLTILHEDQAIVVIDKPAGVAVHPGAGRRSGTLVNALLHHCRDLSGVGGRLRPGIVHRLDRDTTGVLVVAKDDATHRSLAAQFKGREVRKVYEAVVWGAPRTLSGTIDRPVGRHPTARTRMAVVASGRPARTAWVAVRTYGPCTLLEVTPETGRTHQIRVHLSHVGHPVVGDRLYGGRRAAPGADPVLEASLTAYDGLALHARRLGFRHPLRGTWVEFEAPRPRAFQALIDGLDAAGCAVPRRGRRE